MINDGSNYLKTYTVLVLENRPDEAKRVMFVSQFACFPTHICGQPTSFMITSFFRLASCKVSLFHSGLVECST